MQAQYQTTDLPSIYVGNPLIEALPLLQGTEEELFKTLLCMPTLPDPTDVPPGLRRHYLAVLDKFYLPPQAILDVASDVDMAIRRGYLGKAPQTPEGRAYSHNILDQVRSDRDGLSCARDDDDVTPSRCLFVSGHSGIGKSTGIRKVLKRYPRAIIHEMYEGEQLRHVQIVWLSVEAPVNGSMDGLLRALYTEMDRALRKVGVVDPNVQPGKREGINPMTERFYQLGATYSLGVVHIDEIQRVFHSKSGPTEAVEFLIRLNNIVKVPLLFSGTTDVREKVESSFAMARRMSTFGSYEIARPISAKDPAFVGLVKLLLKYQIVDVKLEFSTDLAELIHKISGGVTGIAVLVHNLAQGFAMKEVSRKSYALEHKHYVQADKLRLGLVKKKVESLRASAGDRQ